MKRRVGLITECLIGAVLSGVAVAAVTVQAQAADLPVKAPVAEMPAWWFSGIVEVGGRDFTNNPQNGFQTSTGPTVGGVTYPGVQGQSLAKYYEYSDVRPGPFGNAWLSAGTRDGLYQADFGGTNIGYQDQNYYLYLSKAGEQYLNLGWDQTPHVYSNSALSPWILNGNTLTLVPGAAGKTTAQALAPFAVPTNIGIERDTASASYRWTPDTSWDVKADASYLTRKGTQVGAVISIPGGGPTSQTLRPINDSTLNAGVNGEYVGQSLWGQRFVFKAGYKGSSYQDNLSEYFIYGPTPPASGAPAGMPTPPDNAANNVNATLALDLPWKSRYTGNVSYTMMTQNAAFVPGSTQFNYTAPLLPTNSLQGNIDTTLVNNQLITKLTPDLTSKATYKYYDFDNRTPEWMLNNAPIRDDAAPNTGQGIVTALAMAYTKQNASEDLNWRPIREVNLGATYLYERYDWTRADVDVTNENAGKIYGDYKPWSWLTFRASGYYGNRTYENYNYLAFVGLTQWPTDLSERYNTTYRQLMLDNRQTYKANFLVDFVVLPGLTITPSFKYQEQLYGVDPLTQQGLQDAKNWTTGVDATYVLNPDTTFMVGYTYESGNQLLYGINCTNSTALSTCVAPQTMTTDNTVVNTITAAVRFAVIPQTLETEVRYTGSFGTDNLNLFGSGSGFVNGVPTGGQYPQNSTLFQRLDATGTYKFDPQWVAQMGWKGDIKAKLRYTWERNSVANWQNDPLTPYTTLTGLSSTLWMAWDNPNYNVQMITASLVASW